MNEQKGPLTPGEHDDMRDLVLAGSQRIRPVGSRRAVLASVAVALVLIGGVVGGVAAITFGGPSPVAASPSPAPSASPTVTSIPVDKLPPACLTYKGSDLESASGGEAIAAAAATAQFDGPVTLSPGIRVVESTTQPGQFDALALVCGDGLTQADLVAAGTAIASAIYADPSHAQLSVLSVQAWSPIAADAIAADPNLIAIRTDFAGHDWTSGDVSNAWETSIEALPGQD